MRITHGTLHALSACLFNFVQKESLLLGVTMTPTGDRAANIAAPRGEPHKGRQPTEVGALGGTNFLQQRIKLNHEFRSKRTARQLQVKSS